MREKEEEEERKERKKERSRNFYAWFSDLVKV